MTVKELRELLERVPDDKVVYAYGYVAIEKLVIDKDGDVEIIPNYYD